MADGTYKCHQCYYRHDIDRYKYEPDEIRDLAE